MTDKSVMGGATSRLKNIALLTETMKTLAEEIHSDIPDQQTLARNWHSLAQLDLEFVTWFMAAMPPEVLADALMNVSPERFALIKQIISWTEKKRPDDKK